MKGNKVQRRSETSNSQATGEREAGRLMSTSETVEQSKTVKVWLEKHRELIKDYVPILAILMTASWAIYQFYYVETFKPAHTRPVVTMTSSIEVIVRTDKFIIVNVKTTVHNTGSVSVTVLTAFGNLSAYQLIPVQSTDIAAFDQKTREALLSTKEINLSRYFVLGNKQPLARVTLLKGWWLEPGEQHTVSTDVYLEINSEMDVIMSDFRINVARDAESLGTEWVIEDGDLRGKPCLKSDQKNGDVCHSLKGRKDLWEKFGIGGTGEQRSLYLKGLAPPLANESNQPSARGEP